MVQVGGPEVVRDAAQHAAAALVPALSTSAVTGSRAEWATAVTELQRVVDVAVAAQDAAIVQLAAIEDEFAEDGTLVESHRALGHVALDAPALVSGALTVSSVHAERRVRTAVRLAADGVEGAPASTGLAGLHAAMAGGRLDAYRASVVAEELEEAPPEVASSVVAILEEHFPSDDAPRLRSRCRRVLTRISPDLLRQRARRARAESALRRWVSEPGVDCWQGTFPSEDAATAWAAIDALAQRYVATGECERIDRARAKALTDLVSGNASVETVVTFTVPAGSAGSADAEDEGGTAVERVTDTAPGDLVAVAGLRPGEPAIVDAGWLARAVADTVAVGRDGRGRSGVMACDEGTGAVVDPDDELSSTAYRPGRRLVAAVRARDGHCRFPGCHVAARFCDVDHVRPWPAGPTALRNLMCLCRRHHRVKQLPRWRVTLAADASVSWTDPARRVRVTHPVDALDAIVLPATPGEKPVAPVGGGRTVLADGPHSALEFALEHRLGDRWHVMARHVDLGHYPTGGPRVAEGPVGHRARRRWRDTASDPPPF